jgi:hypothetical protein
MMPDDGVSIRLVDGRRAKSWTVAITDEDWATSAEMS